MPRVSPKSSRKKRRFFAYRWVRSVNQAVLAHWYFHDPVLFRRLFRHQRRYDFRRLLDAGAILQPLKLLSKAFDSMPHSDQKTKRKGMAASKFSVEFAEQKKHRHLPHIQKIIQGGDFAERAKTNALAIFQRLGEAEAKAHDVPIEKVHFHEVGAVDSIRECRCLRRAP